MYFKVRQESGIDWLGSDEVVIETFDSKGRTMSDEIGDMDTGDVHHFDPAKSCIVGVRDGRVVLGESSECDNRGESAPFWFMVKFWEYDGAWSAAGCYECYLET